MKREPAEPQGFIKLTGVGIPRLQAGEDVKLVRLHERAVRVDECERQTLLTQHELDDHTRTGMPVEHAPRRHIDHVPVAGDGLHVASQKRAQRGHEVIPVRIRRRQGKLIHIRSEHDHAVMG